MRLQGWKVFLYKLRSKEGGNALSAPAWSSSLTMQRITVRSAASEKQKSYISTESTSSHIRQLATVYTHTSAHNKRGMSRRTPAALHHRLKQMVLHGEQLYVCGSRRCLLKGCCGDWLLVCLAPTHFVYRETDAFLHKALYNAALSKRIRGLLYHCVREEVMGRVRQATDHYQILKCVFL